MSEYGRRNELLRLLGFANYTKYLRSALWKGIRAAKLARDPNCYGCGKKANSVHHAHYSLELLTGATEVGLFAICTSCHYKIEFTVAGYKRTPRAAQAALMRLHRISLGFRRRRVDNRMKVIRRRAAAKFALRRTLV